jgi:hypothetical protein
MASVALFVSSHGYGHAARVSAIVEALGELDDHLHCHVYTTVPEWFFSQSLRRPFAYHHLETDIGLVQRTSLVEDPQATVERLARIVPPPPDLLEEMVGSIDHIAARVVVCDISPLGMLAAEHAGVPVVLVENFTWDWIYRAYTETCPDLEGFARQLGEVFVRATVRVQTEPVCLPLSSAHRVAPVSRRPRLSATAVRRQLRVPEGMPLVLMTMGGIAFDHGDLSAARRHHDAFFVVPGAAHQEQRDNHLVALPHRSDYYHPDLVAASDLVIGKLGYSTLAEVYHSRAALAFVPRPRFPESPVLAEFATRELGAVDLVAEGMDHWLWLDHIEELIARRRSTGSRPNGARDAARVIFEVMNH